MSFITLYPQSLSISIYQGTGVKKNSRGLLCYSVETNQNTVLLFSEFIDVASNVVAAAQSMRLSSKTFKGMSLDA